MSSTFGTRRVSRTMPKGNASWAAEVHAISVHFRLDFIALQMPTSDGLFRPDNDVLVPGIVNVRVSLLTSHMSAITDCSRIDC